MPTAQISTSLPRFSLSRPALTQPYPFRPAHFLSAPCACRYLYAANASTPPTSTIAYSPTPKPDASCVLVPVGAGAAGLLGFGSPGYNAEKIQNVSKRGHRGAVKGIDRGRMVVGGRRRRRGERVGRESVPVASDRPPAGPRGSPALHRCGRRLRRLRLRPGRRRRGGLLRRRWHSVGSVLHILQAVSPSGAVGDVVGGGFSQESYGLGGGEGSREHTDARRQR